MLAFDNKLAEGQPAADEITVGKANLVLKAAGLNASLITMEQLKFTAPVIFVKIYEAFFDEKVTGINYSPAGRDDHCLNAELIVRALEERFKYQFLERVTGASIMQGDKFSIESIVDLFYGVTQKSISNKGYDDMHQYAVLEGVASSNTIREYYHTQKRYPHVIPDELKTLMDRVNYLENQLHGDICDTDTLTKNKKRSKRKTTKMRRREHTSQSENIMQNDVDDVATVDNAVTNNNNGDMTPVYPSVNHGADTNPFKHTRPSSAPPGGRPRSKSKKSPARKIKYKTSNDIHGKEVLSKLCPAAPTLDELEELRKAQLAKQKEEERKRRQREEEFDKMYTYDTLTGRKLLIAEMERIVEKRHMEHMKKQREDEKLVGREKVKRSHSDPPAPTRAEWPGHRTETSAHAFVDRMSKIRAPPPEEKYPSLNYAQRFAAYDDMDKLDIVISVEHCCNCSFHAMSLRHKPAEYITHANSVLRDLAQVAHQYHPCARVGVVRFNANITKKSKESDVNSRIGALEVQVAYKNADGVVIPELIYSKLKTRRWPSKSVIEKRLRSFMSSVNIQMYEADENDAYDDEMVNGCHTYPVGVGSWEDTALSQTLWQYSSPGTANVRFPVEWVFDSRKRASFPRFKDGTVIYVENVENEHGYTERYGRLGVVKRSFKSAAYDDMVEVKLKYTDEEICVAEENCFPPESYNANYEFEIVNGLPQPLLTALRYFASGGPRAKWYLFDSEFDKVCDKSAKDGETVREFRLCRASFFKNLHSIAWNGILMHGTDEFGMNDPVTGAAVDVQLGYSETVLDMLFQSRDGAPLTTINVSGLVSYVRASCQSFIFRYGEGLQRNGEKTMEDSNVVVEENEESEPMHSPRIDNIEQIKVVSEAIAHTGLESNIKQDENAALDFRERLQQICVEISPPDIGSIEAGPKGDDIENSKYRAGALVIFESLDSDGNHDLDIREFQEALSRFGVNCNENEINKLRAGFDTDGNANITLNEFLHFLHYDNSLTKRDLGDIWSSLRGGVDTPERTQVALVEMEKDLFSMSTFDDTVGSFVSGTAFVGVLDKYELSKQLIEGDLAILLKVFGLDANTKQTIKNLNEYPTKSILINFEEYIVKHDEFCSWLQPADVVLVIKRLSGFVNSMIKNNLAMPTERNIVRNVDDLLAIFDPESTGFIQLNHFQVTLTSFEFPISQAEVRALFRHYGTSSGESMRPENFKKMLMNDASMEELVPVMGSRQYRSQTVVMKDLQFRDDFEVPYQETKAMMVHFDKVDMSGAALEQDFLKRFQIEIKFLLQNLVLKTGMEHKQNYGTRHLDVNWDPLELSVSALKNNADILVQITTSQAVDANRSHNITKVWGTTFFSPKQLMDYDENNAFRLSLVVALETRSDVNITLSGRITECDKSTYSDNDEFYSEDDHDGEEIDIASMSKVAKVIEIEKSKTYHLTLRRVVLSNLLNVKFLRKNDNYATVDLADVWSVRTSVRKESGSNAVWCFDNNEHNVVVDGQLLQLEPIHVSVMDSACMMDNLIGSASVLFTQATCNNDTEVVLQCDLTTKKNKNAGQAQLFFEIDGACNKSTYNDNEGLYSEDHRDRKENDCATTTKVSKLIEIDKTKTYHLTLRKLVLSDILNVELFGKNDNYATVNLADLWSVKTFVRQDSGSNAEWRFDNNEHNAVIEGKILHFEPLHVKVLDENFLKNDEVIGSASVLFTQATCNNDTEIVLQCDLISKKNGNAGRAQLFFEINEHYPFEFDD